jgi:formylglycine-generating enzyme required for sulfatase activity
MNCLPFDFGDSGGTLQFESATYSVAEGEDQIRIYVSRTDGSSGAVSVDYATSDGTALAGSDYTAASGTLSWADGDTEGKYVDVAIIDDAVSEEAKVFTVTLSNVSGGELGSRSQATVTILDTDVAIETVAVGDPGNIPDTRMHQYCPNGDCEWRAMPGYGAVDHSYEIGKYELTAGQYAAFLNAVARTDTYGLYDTLMAETHPVYTDVGCNIQRTGTTGNYRYTVAAEWANRPVNFVTWANAARFVNWLHNGQPIGAQDVTTTEDGSYYLNGATTEEQLAAVTRDTTATWVIPTVDEWYKAAYYDKAIEDCTPPTEIENTPAYCLYWSYPTRNNAVPRNTLDSSGTNNANYFECWDEFSSVDECPGDYTVGAPYYRSEVGALAGSPSAYGTYDQGGNVEEWFEGGGYAGGSYALRFIEAYDDEEPDGISLDAAYVSPDGSRTKAARAYVGFRVGKLR